MSISTATRLLPYCAKCCKVLAEGCWIHISGTRAETTHKLDLCSRCHFERYCSSDCQKAHWNIHKTVCHDEEKAIDPDFIDTIVTQYCALQTGTASIFLNKDKVVTQVQQNHTSSAIQLRVDVRLISKEVRQEDGIELIEQKKIGICYYAVCQQVPFDWKAHLIAILGSKKTVLDLSAIEDLGYRMIDYRLYTQSFEIIAKYLSASGCNDFFSKAIQQMERLGVSREVMNLCATILGKNQSDVSEVLNPSSFITDIQLQINSLNFLQPTERLDRLTAVTKVFLEMDLFDLAFDTVNKWVDEMALKIDFFKDSLNIMIPKNVTYDKISELGRKIGLKEKVIRGHSIIAYIQNHQCSIAFALAEKSESTNFFLDLILRTDSGEMDPL